MPIVKFLDDTTATNRCEDLIKKTWDSIQTGDGKIRQAKRGLSTFYDTNIKTTNGVDVVETLVSVGTGIGIAVLTSSVIALSVGSMGAIPIAMVISFILAILAKKFFNLIRSTRSKSRALQELDLIHQGQAGVIKVEDSDLAEAFITEIYKDIRKIDALLEENASDVQKNAVRSSYSHLGMAYGKLSTNYLFFKSANYGYAVEVGSRLKRIDVYADWLEKYFQLLQKTSADLLDDNFKQTEEWIYRNLLLKVAITDNHLNCTGDLCCAPGLADLKEINTNNKSVDDFLKSSKIKEFADRNQGKSIQQVAATGPKRPQFIYTDPEEPTYRSEMVETAGLVIVDTAQGTPFSVLTNTAINSNFTDPIANAVTSNGINASLVGQASIEAGQTASATAAGAAASSAAFAPLGFAVGKTVEIAIAHYKTNLPVQNKVNVMRRLLQNSASTEEEITQGMEEMLKGVNEKMALRALNKCTEHYPIRIQARMKKLHDMCVKFNEDNTSLNSRYKSVFNSCGQAQAFVRYILKIHHYIDKQNAHISMIANLIKILHKRAYHEKL